MDGLINIVLLLLLLTVLVLLHELGHFIAARRAGVTVHEFGIGFPPRAKVLFRRGDTIYTLNWLPIGGFVRLEGEERSPADGTPDEELQSRPHPDANDPRAFVNQPLRTRLWILFAGVAVNFVLAWVIFTFIALAAQPTWHIRVNEVQPDSPAAAAGLSGGQFLNYELFPVQEGGEPTGEVIPYKVFDDSGDVIVAIDGQPFPVFDDMSRAADGAGLRPGPLQYLVDNASQTVTVTVERADGTVSQVEATLRSAEEIEAGQGAMGFLWEPSFGSRQNGLVESMVIGLERTVETSTLILRAVGSIVVGIFSLSGDGLDDVAGPVGMVGVIGDVRAAFPPVFLLWFVGLISANLAVINFLPIPPLDGSRMLMAVVQRASGDAVSATTERLVYFTGWVALMVFLVIVTIGDIRRLFS